MKHLFRRLTLTLACLSVSVVSFATKVEINGLRYDLNEETKNAEVIKYMGAYYSGDIVVPSVVTYKECDYTVMGVGEMAFYNCAQVTSVELPGTITYISLKAFDGCVSLTKFKIPESVTRIDNQAFVDCAFTAITIPASVTGIGNGAFSSCKELASITIPESVTSLGRGAFTSCSSLMSIQIPGSITKIEDDMFRNCTELETVTIGQGVTSIGNCAFYQCSKLKSVVLPEGVISIGDSAFGWCLSLTSARLASSITSIGEYAFEYCDKLENASLPASLVTIGYRAFYLCESLKEIVIPGTTTKIGRLAFQRCIIHVSKFKNNSGCKDEDDDNWGARIYDKLSADGLYTYGSTAVACTPEMTSMMIPNYVTKFKPTAFMGRTNLRSLSVGNSVKKIESSVFEDCTGLESVTLSNTVECIGKEAFRGCSSLKSIDFGNRVDTLEWGAFYGCSSLEEVTIPSSITIIRDHSFALCNNLKRVNISDLKAWCMISFGGLQGNPLYFAGNLYLNGNKITDLEYPASVPYITSYVFSGFTSLKSISIPSSVECIVNQAFRGCTGLSSITIPSTIDYMDSNVFYGCLFDVNKFVNNSQCISDENWGAHLYDTKTADGIYILKDTIVGFNTDATVITIPEYVKYITTEAYDFTHLANVTDIINLSPIPQTMDDYAFSGQITAPPNLHVPYGCKSVYEDDYRWNGRFYERIFEDAEEVALNIDGRPLATNYHEGTRFDVSGRPINGNKPGIQIIRTSDGRTRKVLVK